jgi:hypothetical protein
VAHEQIEDMAEARRQRILLLRVWRAGDGGSWRAVVEDPRTGNRRGFAELAGLLAFLDDQFGDGAILRPHRARSNAD